ncbi:mitochondrial carrier protein [Pseudohyphozyma bogoriensis]|nr:mitochondrial carrier protein [Pseudohyphozyma bogoriensis]
MSSRLLPTLSALPVQPARLARAVSSSSSAFAPPKKGAFYGKKKGKDAEDGAGGAGSGNVLEQVKAPALDLSGLKTFRPDAITEAAVGEVQAFPAPSITAFKSLTIPSLIQKEFEFTPRPATVVRKITVEAAELIKKNKGKASRDSRHILAGAPGSGKSVVMLQTVSYAQETGWVVLYLPSTTPLIDSSTAHAYSDSQKLFLQPTLSSQLLSKFVAANKPAFKAIKTSKAWEFGNVKVAAGKGLDELASKGGDSSISPAVLEALFEELATQKSHPVLLALDDSQSLFGVSSVVDPTYTAVDSFGLSVPRLLLEYVSGVKSFNSGTVLLAPSTQSKRQTRAFTDHVAAPSAPAPKDDVYRGVLKGFTTVQVPSRLERKEAVGVVQLLQSWRGVRDPVSDPSFLKHYVATDGNPRHFTKAFVTTQQL